MEKVQEVLRDAILCKFITEYVIKDNILTIRRTSERTGRARTFSYDIDLTIIPEDKIGSHIMEKAMQLTGFMFQIVEEGR